MHTQMTVWGVVLLIVFAAAHYAVPGYISAAYMWVVLAIIMIALNMWVGKSMKDVAAASKSVWMSVTIFGFLTTLVVAFGFVPVDVSWLMSLWLLLIGGAIFSEGHTSNMQMMSYSGLVIAVASLFVSGFGTWYFMAGALFFGLLGLINGAVAPSKPSK